MSVASDIYELLCVCVYHFASYKVDLKRQHITSTQQPVITGLSLFLQRCHVRPTANTAHACLHAQHPAAT